VGKQFDQEFAFACGRVFQQLNQIGGLLRVQREGWDTEGGALGGGFAIGF
jgi:hypothetical protein